MIQGINKELLEKRKKFRAYYNEKLRGDYAGLEPVRKKYLREFGLRMAVGIVAAGFYYALCKTRNIPAEIVFSDNAVWVYCLLVSLFWIWVRRPFNKYKQDTKQLVMDKILAFWGGVRYIISGGDSKKVTDAKNTILYAILGLVVALLSYAIVNFVLNIVGSGDAAQIDAETSEQAPAEENQ